MRPVGAIMLFLAVAIGTVPAGAAQTIERVPPCIDRHGPADILIGPAQYAGSVHEALDLTAGHKMVSTSFLTQAAATICPSVLIWELT
jgi:hypothetical protein